jgi:5'-methylthioadenosine phosphorylase
VAARSQPQATVGVIGGSGLYEIAGFDQERAVSVRTPFGRPSDDIVIGQLDGVRVAFLPRHGRGHRLSPSELNFRANIFALKSLGVRSVVAVSAVGSLREEIEPGQLVVPDQFIDRTRGRISTFFGGGLVVHVPFADPVCSRLSSAVVRAGARLSLPVHPSGTYVCMEGPQFSTRAESELYRTWGAHIIGMTNLQEAKLAREASMCFATIAMVTDYDCWKADAGDVDIQEILRVLTANVGRAQAIISAVVRDADGERTCGCADALRDAMLTDRARIPAAARRMLDVLAG